MFESFYGFSASPFLLNPDPAFFFGSKGHASAFAHLKYGVHQGEGFIVITGEIGAGKTTLLRALVEQLDRNEVVAAQLVSTQLEADDLLRSVAVAFGLPVRGGSKAEMLATIEAFLTSLVPQNMRALLVVDEAQNLSPRAVEELRMLSNFQLGTRSLLQSFLVGQPELRALLRSPSMQQLRQRVVSSFHLGPMSAEDSRRYVEHRLRRVGWTDDPCIEAGAFALIHELSGGIPRRINAICSRLLLFGVLEEKHALSRDDVATVGREMQDELGFEPLPAVEPESASQRGDEAARSDGVVRSFAYSSVVARLDRLEKAVNTLIELLRPSSPPAEKRAKGSGRGAAR